MRTFWSLISEAFNEWLEDKAQRLGAALAYYAAFSIAPLLILVVAIVDFFYKGDTFPQIERQIAAIAGGNAAEVAEAAVRALGIENGPSYTQLRIGPDDVPTYFNGTPSNVGVILVDGLVDVDLDCPQAIRLELVITPKGRLCGH